MLAHIPNLGRPTQTRKLGRWVHSPECHNFAVLDLVKCMEAATWLCSISQDLEVFLPIKCERCMAVLCAVHYVSNCLCAHNHLSATHNAALRCAPRKHGKHLHSRYRCAIVPRTWLRCLVLQMSARQVKPRPIVHLRTLTMRWQGSPHMQSGSELALPDAARIWATFRPSSWRSRKALRE